jgi:hypothetical protein
MTKVIPACAEFRRAENGLTIVVTLDDDNFHNISQALGGQKPVEASMRFQTLTQLHDKYPNILAYSPILLDIKIGEIKVTGIFIGQTPTDFDDNVKFVFCSSQDPTRKICADGSLFITDLTRLQLQQLHSYREKVGMEHLRLSAALQQPQGRSFTMGIGV